MSYFKKGQKVYSHAYGEGIVIGIDGTGTYPLTVNFNGYAVNYTLDGKENTKEVGPSLSQKPLEPIILTSICEFKEGDLVWVADSDVHEYGWTGREFLEYQEKEEYPFVTVNPGGTKYNITRWKHCVPFKPRPF